MVVIAGGSFLGLLTIISTWSTCQKYTEHGSDVLVILTSNASEDDKVTVCRDVFFTNSIFV